MEYSDQELKLREDVLGLLLKNFGNTSSNKNIYECADDWCSKQVTTAGLVNYYKAYDTGEKYK